MMILVKSGSQRLRSIGEFNLGNDEVVITWLILLILINDE